MLNVRLHIEVVDKESGTTEDYSLDPSEGPILIGRDRNCRVVLASPSVSRKHCTLEPDEAGWVAVDTSSLGSRLNDKSLPKGQRKRVQHGDRLEIANYDLKISIVALTDPTLKADPMALRRLMDEVRNEAVHPCIWVFLPNTPVKEHYLPEERAALTIGRSAECDVILPDPMRVVSSFHAKIERSFAGVFLYDTSTNGIFVNGEKVDNGVALSDGDRVTVAVAEEDLARPLLVFTAEGNSSTPEGPRVAGAAAVDPGGTAGAGSSGGAVASRSGAGTPAGSAGGAKSAGSGERRGAFDPAASDADAGGRSFFGDGTQGEPAKEPGRDKGGKAKRASRNSLVDDAGGGSRAEDKKPEAKGSQSVLAEVQRAIADVEAQEQAVHSDAVASGAGEGAGAGGRKPTGDPDAGASAASGPAVGGRSNLLLILALAVSALALLVVLIWGIILMRG